MPEKRAVGVDGEARLVVARADGSIGAAVADRSGAVGVERHDRLADRVGLAGLGVGVGDDGSAFAGRIDLPDAPRVIARAVEAGGGGARPHEVVDRSGLERGDERVEIGRRRKGEVDRLDAAESGRTRVAVVVDGQAVLHARAPDADALGLAVRHLDEVALGECAVVDAGVGGRVGPDRVGETERGAGRLGRRAWGRPCRAIRHRSRGRRAIRLPRTPRRRAPRHWWEAGRGRAGRYRSRSGRRSRRRRSRGRRRPRGQVGERYARGA